MIGAHVLIRRVEMEPVAVSTDAPALEAFIRGGLEKVSDASSCSFVRSVKRVRRCQSNSKTVRSL